MKPLACRYSIVQFVPYAETGEFANVGIVLTCPQSGYFGFLLQSRKSKRVTDFFDALDRDFYKSAIKAVEEELSRLEALAHSLAPQAKTDALRGMMAALEQPREAIVRFSPARVVLTQDPARELQQQFDHYVDHAFATPEYVERTMNDRLRTLLGGLELQAPFRSARIGNEYVSARFDFVQTVGTKPRKIIKALHLGQSDANDIAAHGDVWAGKIARLIRQRELTGDILVNVSLPPQDKQAHREVSQDIMRELEHHKVIVVAGEDQPAMQRIKEFAQQ